MKKVLIVLLMFNFCTFAQERDSLFVSLGGGYGYSELSYINNKTLDRSQSYNALVASMKLGLMLDAHLAIFFLNNTQLFQAPFYKKNRLEDAIYFDSLNGVGATYFFSNDASFFVSASAGVDVFSTFNENNTDLGSAYLFSFGYEFENRYNIELVIRKFSDIASSDNELLSIDAQSTQLIVGYSFY